MIYNRDESEVAVLGDVQKYKVGIDERNINHIVTILSSNLYSHPMTSFLRETVSNAVDSHIEAGVDEPIIITRTKDSLAIRDFGTGISPERFQEIYLNIGSSTKRQSNDYIGSFGIGRFSCLSVSDLANITSFYNGKAYYYVMNKDVDQLHIDLLFEKDTDEHNGVEVKIPLKTWDAKMLKCLSFIENLYVDSEIDYDTYDLLRFNKRKIYTHKTFKVLSECDTEYTEILLGKIPYRVDYNSLWDFNDSKHKSWERTLKFVYPMVQIGDVDITPNRESLLYSERTKKVLRKIYDDCIKELTELWDLQCNHEHEDIAEYAIRLVSFYENVLTLDDIRIPMSNGLAYNASYKKYPEWRNIDVNRRKGLVNQLLYKSVEMFGKLSNGTMFQGQRQQRYFTLKKLLDDWVRSKTNKVVALPHKSGFSSNYFKSYVCEKYPDTTILFIRQLSHPTVASFKRFVIDTYGMSTLANKEEMTFIFQLVKEVINYLNDKIEVTDIISSPEYAQFKKLHATPKNRKKLSNEKIICTIWDTHRTSMFKRTDSVDGIVKYVKNEYENKHRIVYADLDNPFISALYSLHYPNLIVLSAAKGNMKTLKDNVPEWVKPIEVLYSPDNKTLQRYAALHYINTLPGQFDRSFTAYNWMPKLIRMQVHRLHTIRDAYSYYASRYSDTNPVDLFSIVPFEKYDSEIMFLFNNTRKYLEISHKLDINLPNCDKQMAHYLLMKAKKMRIDFEYYSDIRENINRILKSL